jgi:predicted dehydrogenase
MDQLGIGVVGCGYWGINYARVFSELPDTTVITLCDLDQERLSRMRQRFPLVDTATNMQQLVDDPRIAAVVVATPSSTHYEVTRQCLVHGKHVLVEKPFVMRVADGQELIDLAATGPAVLMVGHTFLYNPGIQKMKECMRSDDCGEIYYLHATRTNLGPIRHDANALWDLAPHDISIFNYLLEQQPVSVTAVGMKSLHNSREDVGFVTLTYPGGILGHIHVSWIDPDKVREVVVVGSKRRILFNDLNNLERLRIFEKGVAPVADDVNGYGEFQLRIRDGDIVSPKVETSEPLKNECAHFVACIKQGQTPLSDGRQGLDVVRVLVAIDESLKRHGAPVSVPD